jgi:predicted TIM-barrel enzyme
MIVTDIIVIDLIIIYNSGRFRMAGHCSIERLPTERAIREQTEKFLRIKK